MNKLRELMSVHFITSAEIETHYHQNMEIIYILKGDMLIDIDDASYRLGDGDFILINANKRHAISAKDVFGARFVIDFHLLAEYMGTIQLMFWCNTVVDRNDSYKDLRRVMDKMLKWTFEKTERAGDIYLNSLGFEAVYLLASNFMVNADDSRLNVDNSQKRVRINQIQNYIQANYQSQISLNELSEKLFLSNAYLSKFIKKNLGLSFGEYLNNVRLFHAVDELLYSNKNLTHIAMDNGFPNSAAFTKAFRDAHGCTPSEYRKNIEKSEDVQKEKDEENQAGRSKILEYLEYKEKQEEVLIEQELTVTANAKHGSRRSRLHNEAVNVGEAYSLLQSDVQKRLIEIKNETGVIYARIWNLLAEQYSLDEKGNYNYRKIDLVLDFLVDNDLTPYIDLGYKPSLFNYTPERNVIENKKRKLCDFDKFSGIIEKLFQHIVNRYGHDEVEKWVFEFWNDPDLNIKNEDGEYYKYFQRIYISAKNISELIKIGGAGFILGYETPVCKEIFTSWGKQEIKPDFLSFVSFQYVSMIEDGRLYGQKSLDGHYMQNQVSLIRELIEEVQFDVKELHINEWNFTVSNNNILNDSIAQGAYIIMNSISMAGKVDFMAYWHGIDISSGYSDSDAILCGDSGMMSRDGIRKPSFYAFQFLNRLQANVISKDEHSIVTSNGRGHYVIVCHNYKKLSSRYVFTEEDKIRVEEQELYMENVEPVKMTFNLQEVNNGKYLIKSSYINKENGNVQEIWKELGFAKRLSQEEIEYLKNKAIPSIEMKMQDVNNEILEIECVLQAQEIRMIDVQFRYGQD